ncbi:MAG: hypothetical protein OEW75_02415 [Cyclobacteriaceae bacterium]|nr:hypothetical protein [Cyclobacteriaceae bacterium]
MKKFLALILIYSSAVLVSCFNGVCDDFRYFDFKGIEFDLYKEEILPEDSLEFRIISTDGYFLGMSNPKSFLFNQAFALSCEVGTDGLKYPIESFVVTSNSDFNSNYMAGTPLNDLIMLNAWIGPHQFEYITLNEADISKNYETYMYISEAPTLSQQHELTISLTKSNGEQYLAKTGLIQWK